MTSQTTENAESAVRQLLHCLGEDPEREGLKDTPRRYVKFLDEFLNPPTFSFTTFSDEKYDEMVIVKDIPFFSLCEHHMAPFFGTAAIAYIPAGKIVGLSKLPRCLQHYANKLQNQERITQQVADRLQKELQPKGVAVQITARHMCMEMRGVKSHDTKTTTCKLIGAFHAEAMVRAEFFNHLK